jgi:probable F420-dependent oxidoreductase
MRTRSGVQVGIAIPQTFPGGPVDVGLVREFVARAEALEYDSLWVVEQIIGAIPSLEPVSLLAYVSAITSRARIGSAVLVTNLRNPVQLAKSLATVDQLSRGRLIVGIGLGPGTRVYPVFGVPPERRVRRFVEGVQVMKALWTQPATSHQGELWRLEGVAMEPKPVQKPHPPLWFGARVPDALRRAALHGDGWMGAGSSSGQEFKQQLGQLRQALREVGRDPATFSVAKRVYLAVDDDEERASRRLQEWFGHFYRDPAMALRVGV